MRKHRGLSHKYLMQIDRLTYPQFHAFNDDERETWLRLDAGQDTATISMLVASATDYVEGHTGLCLPVSTYRATFDEVQYRYRLPIAPVQTITTVEYRDCAGTFNPVTGWYHAANELHFTTLPPGAPIVTLQAGFADRLSVPVGLRHAIAVLVSAGYNGREELSDQTIKTVHRLCARHKRFAW